MKSTSHHTSDPTGDATIRPITTAAPSASLFARARGLLAGRPGPRVPDPIEPLERRLALDTEPVFTFTAYYAEGFAGAAINEFVPVTNPNSTPVTVELLARYEFGERDHVIGRQTIPATTRGGFTLSDAANGGPQAGLRANVPYALILRATAVVSATFSHYDFGTAIGESFTIETSTTWTFADGIRDSTRINNQEFILVFNPADTPTTVTLTVYQTAREPQNYPIILQPQRRGGWAINDIPALVDGRYGARIVASAPVVAVNSRYQPTVGRGEGSVGLPLAGSTAGVLPRVEYRDDFYDVNGDDRSKPRAQADTVLSILNPNPQPARVVLTFVEDSATSGSPEVLVQRVINVGASSLATLSVRSLGVLQGTEFNVAYTSDRPVTLAASVEQGMDALGVHAITRGANTWEFGEGYMSASRAGREVLETIHLFNPSNLSASVTLTFYFHNQTAPVSFDLILSPGQYRDFDIHTNNTIRFRGGSEIFFGFTVTSSRNIVAFMEHWDAGNGGGFGTFGMPRGTTTPLSGLLDDAIYGTPGGGLVG